MSRVSLSSFKNQSNKFRKKKKNLSNIALLWLGRTIIIEEIIEEINFKATKRKNLFNVCKNMLIERYLLTVP